MTHDAFATLLASFPAGSGRVHLRPGAIAEIVLDDPSRKNPLDAAMMAQMGRAAEVLAGARVILLRGEGGAFCSGGNLGALRETLVRPGLGRALGAFMARAVANLRGLGVPLVAVVDGPALGGGAELLAACDLVFATPVARVGWVQARLGVSPGFSGGARLVARVGAAKAARLLTEARLLTAEEAMAAGVVDEVVPDALAAARAYAARVVELPEAAVRGALRVSRIEPSAEAAAAELDVFDSLWGGPAHLAALATPRRHP